MVNGGIMNNILRETISEALKDIHIETGRKDDFERVVNRLEIDISEKILSQDIDIYTEGEKDFSGYDLFQ